MLYILVLFLSTPDLNLELLTRLEKPGDYQISAPSDGLIDPKGRVYLLDSGEKCVYVWNQGGSFLTRLGNKGNGPGEFNFSDPARSLVAYHDSNLYVLDDKSNKIHLFSGLKFNKTISKSNAIGRIAFFKCLPNGKFVVWEQEYRKKIPWSMVYLTDINFQHKKILAEWQDPQYTKNKEGGWDFRVEGPIPVISPFDGGVFLGNAVENNVIQFNLEGDKVSESKIRLYQDEFKEEDKLKLRKTYKWMVPPHRFIWPDKKRRFNIIFPVNNKPLACKYEPFLGTYDCKFPDGRSFSGDFNGGGLLYSRGVFIVVSVQQDGDYSLSLERMVHPRS